MLGRTPLCFHCSSHFKASLGLALIKPGRLAAGQDALVVLPHVIGVPPLLFGGVAVDHVQGLRELGIGKGGKKLVLIHTLGTGQEV